MWLGLQTMFDFGVRACYNKHVWIIKFVQNVTRQKICLRITREMNPEGGDIRFVKIATQNIGTCITWKIGINIWLKPEVGIKNKQEC